MKLEEGSMTLKKMKFLLGNIPQIPLIFSINFGKVTRLSEIFPIHFLGTLKISSSHLDPEKVLLRVLTLIFFLKFPFKKLFLEQTLLSDFKKKCCVQLAMDPNAHKAMILNSASSAMEQALFESAEAFSLCKHLAMNVGELDLLSAIPVPTVGANLLSLP